MAGRIGRRLYKTPAWRAVRQAVFRRDGWRCRECGTRVALECDHIRPITQAGDWLDMDNLQTLCRGCHIQKTARTKRAERIETDARAELAAMAMEGR